MKSMLAGLVLVLFALLLATTDVAAQRAVDDPRRKCREAIQKSQGLGKDAKVSRKELDRCVANGGRV